ncbi:prepilin-type N-terminal cleavage/methylation domain-containing protein [Limisalsivibrio acetivorans]|uniref:prepilin-type N-terminal cleavage/methylation domain-containing protein n=1 Tax=Limisalsivibrio acetivorans TaxID=1304888 RepID=UPI0003B6C393|nr:prepilin-type N-terminal cleavage/methylation domain-containing protein [Limisalsivibrio acetivorans]
MNKQGFTIVEVLVAMVVVTAAIAVANMSYKIYLDRAAAMQKYELLYNTALSLKDTIEAGELSDGKSMQGELNGFEWDAEVNLLANNRNYHYAQADVSERNEGAFEMYLYRIDLTVGGQETEFYRTVYEKRADIINMSQ